MSATKHAGQQARTDGEESISDNSSGCAVCGAPPTGVRAAGGETLPVCEAHAAADPREGDLVSYVSQGMICAGTVTKRGEDALTVDGVAEEQITVGQVLDVIERDGGA